jgi:hypothetical protein
VFSAAASSASACVRVSDPNARGEPARAVLPPVTRTGQRRRVSFRFARGSPGVFLIVGKVKNFPHQYNDLAKLRETLETIRDLGEQGLDSNDDAVLGYELARRMVYGFRGLDKSGDEAAVAQRIAERLEIEKDKPAYSQGTQTAAREMRRTLRLLGWLEEQGTTLTPAGEELLATTQGSDEENVLMQQAIGGIAVEDKNGHVSHPVQILLRLVDEVSLDSRKGMEVALEALDDSVPEFRRVAEIAAMSEDDRIRALSAAGWTKSQFANAVKILPALALQSGLMTKDGSGHFILTDAGRRAIGRAIITVPAVPPTSIQPSRRRSTRVATNDPEQVGRSRRLLNIDRRTLTPEEQAAAAELLYERTERHQALVRAVAAQCRRGEFYEDVMAYDLLIDLGSDVPLILIEVKTVAGDAALRIRAAVGQLLYYEYFSVVPAFPGREIRRVVVVDDTVSDELADFLQANQIGLITYVDEDFAATNDLGNTIAGDLFE